MSLYNNPSGLSVMDFSCKCESDIIYGDVITTFVISIKVMAIILGRQPVWRVICTIISGCMRKPACTFFLSPFFTRMIVSFLYICQFSHTRLL